MGQHLLIPLSIPQGQGFYNTDWNESQTIRGHRVSVVVNEPYYYLVLADVQEYEAQDLISLTSKLLHWASIKLGFSLRVESSTLQSGVETGMIVDGGSPVLFNGTEQMKPSRFSGSTTSQGGDVALTRALSEASSIPTILGEADSEFRIACELFSAVNFKSTTNAQFIVLTSVLEIMSKPKERAPSSVALLDELIEKARAMSKGASTEVVESLESLVKNAGHWKKESFRGSIRIMAKRVAQVFGDTNFEQAGKRAVELYDKRSSIVHGGASASYEDLKNLRQLVRETLAVEAGSIEGIRG